MTVHSHPPHPYRVDGRQTFALARRIIAYNPALFLMNMALWASVYLLPAAMAWTVSELFRRLELVMPSPGAELGGAGMSAVWLMLGAFAAVRLLRFGLFYAAFLKFIELIGTAGALLRRNLLNYLLTASGTRALPDTPAEAVSRFRDDVEDVNAYIEAWVDGFGMALFVLVSVALMLRVDALLTLVTVAPLFLMIVVVSRLSPRIRTYRRRMREATARVTDFIGETFGAVGAVKLAGREEEMVAHLHVLGQTRQDAALKDVLLTELIRGVNTNMVFVATGLVLLLGARLVLGGQMVVADFVLFIGLLPRLTGTLGFFGDWIATHRRTGVAFERMNRLLADAPPEEPTRHAPLGLRGELPALSAPAALAEPLRELEVRGLTAQYGAAQYGAAQGGSSGGVQDVNLKVRRGQFVVVTGRIGSGKSTLVRALLGLLPHQRGEILWNGERVDDPASFFVPPRSSYTAQLPGLFSDTLRENVLSGSGAERLDRAVRLAQLDTDLAQLGSGLDTPVGARGVKLSGGQVQRTAVARMLARDADLLVFDDVSSALDARTESALWDALGSELDATCLVVSHRRAALGRADWVVVLQGGRVLDQGTLPDLLERCGEMQALWAEEGA
ncbi:Xenobiotic-transporting ATPase (plasmid) [Deinococcus proteolyticus MRP]|uniref:Xenobiotic-transporting ATPase n=1 Tax=Deinococcus proteolyticus (strain ATCC 35074 / DSM 20540 / JCM 6276 / NBRC 101906 / NCIMB 13154 / VKM Ac-1939 / CCM 2703 / MRP) TaxID=693977 RepID=F0RPS2_DEIPM|nr:ABC transporter ATP-binding protein [Deinococcus proteolyticus]ADY27378.1 Xenobiotic-transporting ATPase [Deinococcus proteolyticus MRP]